jgi:carbamoyltransferase
MVANQGTPIYILGTHVSHDGSACLLKDGRICVAIEKERITRRKHAGGNDADAIKYCLEAAGITFQDLALVVQNANFGMLAAHDKWWRGARLFDDSVPIVTISHHLAHAYSAIGTAPFDEAAVLTLDGCGNGLDECIDLGSGVVLEDPPTELRHLYFEKDSYYQFADNKLSMVVKDFSEWGTGIKNYPLHPSTTKHSIGGLYLAASMYAFNGFEDAGKLMGLAPYGKSGVYDFEMFELKEGRVFVRYDWMTEFNQPCHGPAELKANFQYYADFAYWVQKELERAILYVVNSRYDLSPSDNLAYTGGVALNAVANRRVLKESKFKNLYIQPAAGDNGLALGCAYYGWMEVLKRERVKHSGSMYLGKTYGRQSVVDILPKYKQLQTSHGDDYIIRTAQLLAEGKTIGWFQDAAEFGPRALGNRSILADPRRPEMRDFINARIKFREDFRPFAPSVLKEDVGIYFDCDYESPYMILVAPVREEWREKLPSVIHCDHSARIQTVTQVMSPKYYELLRAFKEITGISVLLNTSFNRKGMPIVETPEQAIDFFLHCELDVLVLDNFIIRKAESQVRQHVPLTKVFTEDLIGALERNFVEARKLGGIYQINISGIRSWIIDLSRDMPVVIEGLANGQAHTTINIAQVDFDALLADPERESIKLFQSGKIQIEGDPRSAMNVPKLFSFK